MLGGFADDELVSVERWAGRDELALALEGPVWDRYGQFAGHPRIRGAVMWSLADRRILIAGQRGDEAFEEASHEPARRSSGARLRKSRPSPRRWRPTAARRCAER